MKVASLALKLDFMGVKEVLGFEVAKTDHLVRMLITIFVEQCQMQEKLLVLLRRHLHDAPHGHTRLHDALLVSNHAVYGLMEGLSEGAVKNRCK